MSLRFGVGQNDAKSRPASGLLAAFCLAALLGGGNSTAAEEARGSPERPEVGAQQALPLTDEAPDLAEEALRVVRDRLKSVNTSDRSGLANALGLGETSPTTSAPGQAALTEIPDLDGDGTPEVILRWTHSLADPSDTDAADADVRSWALLFLAWDGAAWRASKLLAGDEDYVLEILPQRLADATAVAVVLMHGEMRVPFPVVFQVRDHAAVPAWDSRAEESRYEGYARGKVEFRRASGAPEMVASGKADPGVIIFQPESPRGFTATTVFRWQEGSYVPVHTEYSANADYALYRFIAALHTHDFRSAYALIDPARFLKTDKPTLDMFRRKMEDSWPEFLDDQVFDVPEEFSEPLPAHAFELKTDEGQTLYVPTFSDDGRHLIVGLEKRDVK